MARPVRIKLSRKKGFRLQEHSLALNGLPAVKVDRRTQWGNNFAVADFDSVEDCVAMFEHDLAKFATFHPAKYRDYITPLIGKNLGCWCALDAPACHADVLLSEAEEYRIFNCVEVA